MIFDARIKEILRDKRIRRFGVHEHEYQNYLNAEQFVLDMRDFTNDDDKELCETFIAMRDFGIYKPPYDRFVIHALCRANGVDLLSSAFFMVNNEGVFFNELFETEEAYSAFLFECQKDSRFTSAVRHHCGILHDKLIVMLNTRNIVKERHEPPKAQRMKGKSASKRGSGGYTVIRPPRADEMPGYDTGTHASPRPHLRRGHVRHLQNGGKTWVQPCFVNGEPEERRIAYLRV